MGYVNSLAGNYLLQLFSFFDSHYLVELLEWSDDPRVTSKIQVISSFCLHKSLSSANFSVSKHIIISPPKLRQDISGIQVVSTLRVLPHQQWPLKGFELVGASFVTVNGRGEHPNAYMLHVYHISFFIFNTSYIMYHIYIYTSHIMCQISYIMYQIIYYTYIVCQRKVNYMLPITPHLLTAYRRWRPGRGPIEFDWGHPNVEDP